MAAKLSATFVATPAVLRPLRDGDSDAIARWYGKAMMLAGSPVPLSSLLDFTGRRRTLTLTDGTRQEPVGLMAMAVDDPEPGWATIAFLAIAGQDRRDLAARAIATLEASVQGQARHIRAAVPPDVGLALYFWLRLGYRPTAAPEDGHLWMVRDLD